MRSTAQAWDIQEECKQKPQDNCLVRLLEILWFSGISVSNAQYKQNNDERMVISSTNGTTAEFGSSYVAYLKKEDKLGSDKDGVSSLLTDVAFAIQSYFSAKGTWIRVIRFS